MAKLITFSCPDCGKNISASFLERNTRCEHCGKLIDLTKDLDLLADSAKIIVPSRVKIEHPQDVNISVPPQIKIEHAGDVLRIEYFWYETGFKLKWALLFGFFLIFNGREMLLLDTNVGIPAIYPYVWILMLVVVFFVNFLFTRTVIEIRGDQLSIRIVPGPWFKSMSIKTSEIARLFFSKCTSVSNRDKWWYGSEGGFGLSRSSYMENAIFAYRKNSMDGILLVPNLPSMEAALFVKHMIETVCRVE